MGDSFLRRKDSVTKGYMGENAVFADAFNFFLYQGRQVEQIGADHRRQGDGSGHSHGEYLSGFYKEDQLLPVVTLVIFFSPDRWDEPVALHDTMSGTDPKILKLVEDYSELLLTV